MKTAVLCIAAEFKRPYLGECFTSWYVTAKHFLGKSVAQLPMQYYKDWKP